MSLIFDAKGMSTRKDSLSLLSLYILGPLEANGGGFLFQFGVPPSNKKAAVHPSYPTDFCFRLSAFYLDITDVSFTTYTERGRL